MLSDSLKGKATFSAFPVLTKENIEEKGVICIRKLDANLGENDSTLLKCHANPIYAMAFSADITHLAVAPKYCNIIRIFNLITGKMTKEVRRSFLSTEISSLSFDSKDGDWLLVSDKLGDSEIFYVHRKGKKEADLNMIQNRRSLFRFLGGILPYFNSEWNFASYRNSEEADGVSRFLEDGTFVIVSRNGNVCNLNFDKIFGGESLEVRDRRNFLIMNDN